ncbi:RND transporter [Paraburkholderia phytofirmans OLGA172]|uniref:RND transporter n=1 Tax=Paraburkholderia phytofirmans OLGA172 TaxID=1417228 RepID=A0A161IBA3_9BURK|nr:MMPL family transporter [Paraburkholderia phytofirmans]ANB73013.1 RND transporter [Paraburkholderia phytofirmans OLGA172]
MNNDTSLAEQPVIRDLNDFDRNSGSWAERLLFNNRLAIIVVSLLLTVTLGLQATKLTLNAGFEKMIPTKHPFVVNYLANRSELAGLGNTLNIAVENTNGTIFDAAYLEALRKLNDEIFLLPGVDRAYMKSLWTPSTRWLGVTEGGLEGGPVIPDDYDGSTKSIDQLRANIERSGQVGQLVANNYRSSIIRVPLLDSDSTGRRLDYHEFSGRLEQLQHKYESPSIKIHVTGFAKVVGDLIDGLQQVLLFLALAIAICTALLYWYTRCVRSTLLVVTCSLLAVVWLLGLLPTLGFEIDPYSILVPFLVFAIGMSHGAQKMNGIMQDIGRGTHKLVAARYTFRRLFLAGLTALLADAVGFAVLMVIQIKVIQDLAITASIGVAVLIFTNLVLLPILLSYVGVSRQAASRSLNVESQDEEDLPHKKHPFWAFLDLFTQRKWARLVLLVAASFGIAGFAVSLHLQIGDLKPGAPELRSTSRYNRDNAFTVANYSASSDTYVVMVKTPQYECTLYKNLEQVDALEWQLQQLPGVESTNSVADLAKNAATAMNEGSLKWYEIPRSQDMVNSITNRAPRELFNQSCDLLTIYIYLKDHKASTLDSVVRTVQAFADRNNTANHQFLSAAGNAGIEAATNIVVKHAHTEMLLLVYAAVIVLAFITFRSWRAVLCAVLPLMLTTVLAEALMVVLGIGVKVATLPVIALGVGIGVDYALYVLTVALSRLRQGASLSQAYYQALLFTGKVVVLTGVTLGVAVATWALSPIKFQADMGILLAFMFILNMVGALVLLPALACFLLPRGNPMPKGKPSTTAGAAQAGVARGTSH